MGKGTFAQLRLLHQLQPYLGRGVLVMITQLYDQITAVYSYRTIVGENQKLQLAQNVAIGLLNLTNSPLQSHADFRTTCLNYLLSVNFQAQFKLGCYYKAIHGLVPDCIIHCLSSFGYLKGPIDSPVSLELQGTWANWDLLS